ncbi:CAAX prenyl protease-related protein [Aquabacterium sp.]|uniref:CAAX prenyl protease-related protein n=1 Tax=Aquabacterium sp. TaxID=1872578 RepID=UPI001983195B|nr:CAAX prenyl protease-related protein [Aquabacterium sp.]MBC7699881.1 CAAX prenyl protease-related protein [Aquabacterium sp.]
MGSFLSRSVLARVVPFVLFMVMLALRGHVPADGSWGVDPRWLYGASVLVVSGSLLFFWRDYQELARGTLPAAKELVLAVIVGVVVFYLWVNLAQPWMMLGEATASFRPVDSEGRIEWGLVAVRWVGAALMVPVMEELFWRSYLMRWVDNPDFVKLDPRAVTLKAVALSTVVFMLAHTQWLAAILAGLAYAWLYKRTGSLWAPILAHAVTNGVLGVWVVLYGNWQFW